MGLEIFKKENELNQGVAIEECKTKIEEILKKQETVDRGLSSLEREFVSINKDNVTKFLTEEIKFIVNNKGKEDVYSYEREKYKCKISIEFNDFNARSFVVFYINGKKSVYTVVCGYKDLVFSKLNWEMEEYGVDKLKRTDRTVIQENKKYWNKELKIAEESYNDNYKSLIEMQNLDSKDRFKIIVTDENSNDTEFEDLKGFIRSLLENVE